MSTHIERGHDYPSITQISVFLDNRVGRLLGLVQTLEVTDVRIVALSVMDSADCAIVRMVVDDVDTARNALLKGNYPFSEAELIAVELPPGKGGIKAVCTALLSAELNIHYAYPLMARPHGQTVLALHVDDYTTGLNVLHGKKFTTLSQGEMGEWKK